MKPSCERPGEIFAESGLGLRSVSQPASQAVWRVRELVLAEFPHSHGGIHTEAFARARTLTVLGRVNFPNAEGESPKARGIRDDKRDGTWRTHGAGIACIAKIMRDRYTQLPV